MALVTCVGSLTCAVIRHANRPEGTVYRGHYEISLVGTIDPLAEHLHLTITDGEGRPSAATCRPARRSIPRRKSSSCCWRNYPARAPCPWFPVTTSWS